MTQLEHHLVVVGQPYSARRHWPEGVEFNWKASSGCVLRLFWNQPSLAEVLAINSGRIEYGLFVEADQVLFLFRPAGWPHWSDAPYTWHRVDPAEREPLPDFSPGHALLSVVLVEATTGIVMALRSHTLHPRLTRQLFQAIRYQATCDYDPDLYNAQLDRLRRRFSSDQLAAHAGATCWGGD
jgi:hypothetical protein